MDQVKDKVMLDRRTVMASLVANRPDDLLVVPGLGSTTWDLAAAGDDDRNFYLWGAMGGAAMIGLGLALARSDKRVLVVTGDGEMLMGLGSLGTIGLQNPPNLAIVVFDNAHYGETGMQESHTQRAVSLASVASSCGFENVLDIADEAGLAVLASQVAGFSRLFFARVRIKADDPPRVLPLRGGVALKERFRRAVGVER